MFFIAKSTIVMMKKHDMQPYLTHKSKKRVYVVFVISLRICPVPLLPLYLCLVTVLLGWTVGLPRHQRAQLHIYHLVSAVNILPAVFNLEKQTLVNSLSVRCKITRACYLGQNDV